MADTTDIYGIRFPQDGDSIDTAGDMQQLAETSEIALGGVNWDTATQEQKDAVAASTAPVSLFGAGRPDAAGDNIQAPVGSVYTCTDPNDAADKNLGARVWRRTVDGWAVAEGNYHATVANTDPFFRTFVYVSNGRSFDVDKHVSITGGTAPVLVFDMSAETLTVKFQNFRFDLNMVQPGGWTEATTLIYPASYSTLRPVGFPIVDDLGVGTIVPADSAVAANTGGVYQRGWRVYSTNNDWNVQGTDAAYPGIPTARFHMTVTCSLQFAYTSDHNLAWPTNQVGVGRAAGLQHLANLRQQQITELKAKIEQAAKDNPELAEQLRQELEALQAEAGE